MTTVPPCTDTGSALAVELKVPKVPVPARAAAVTATATDAATRVPVERRKERMGTGTSPGSGRHRGPGDPPTVRRPPHGRREGTARDPQDPTPRAPGSPGGVSGGPPALPRERPGADLTPMTAAPLPPAEIPTPRHRAPEETLPAPLGG